MPRRAGGSTGAVFRARCFEGETGHRRATPRARRRAFFLFPDPPGRFTKCVSPACGAFFFDLWRTFKKKRQKRSKGHFLQKVTPKVEIFFHPPTCPPPKNTRNNSWKNYPLEIVRSFFIHRLHSSFVRSSRWHTRVLCLPIRSNALTPGRNRTGCLWT